MDTTALLVTGKSFGTYRILDHQVAADTTGAPRRTRSLCRYPTWPKYQGGDINVVASAVCAVH